MKLFTEAFLDKWEERATQRGKRWEKKHPPKWVLAINPDLRLQPTEGYTFRLYMRQMAYPVLPLIAFILLGRFTPLVYLWFRYPVFFQNRGLHRSLIGELSHLGYYFLPWEMLFFLAFNGLLYLPRFYFWNRRAERLRRAPLLPDAPAGAVALDTSVWPPPPKKPAG